MWRSTGAHVTSVEARRRAWDRSSLLTLFKQGLWLADAYVRLSGWNPRDPPVSAPDSSAEIAKTHTGSGDLNSGPCVCMASAFNL